MRLVRLSIIARKIHRFFVLIIVILGFPMSITGAVMKYPQLFPFMDYSLARQTHNTISGLFSPVLAIMSVTGLFMYLYPFLIKTFRKNSPPGQSS
jgi:hypothetical protein